MSFQVMRGRALILLGLLVLSGLAGLAPVATAQSDTAICFDHDPSTVGVGSFQGTELGARQCQTTVPPDYLQGQAVTIRLNGFTQGTVTQLRARCVAGCPAPDATATAEYFADYEGNPLVFPTDFTRPFANGDPALARSAALDRAGRYNSTWEITVFVGTAPSLSREFHVWSADFYAAEEGRVRPGSMHRVQLTGFDGGAEVEVRIERRVGGPNGAYQVLDRNRQRVPASGFYTDVVVFPKDEGKHIVACADAPDCYRLVARGNGKLDQTVTFRVAPAEIRRNTIATPEPSANPALLDRTQDVAIRVDLMFPPGGNGASVGQEFSWQDAPLGVNGKPQLDVLVEKQFTNDTAGTRYLVAKLNATYRNDSLAWVTNWTPAKDLPIEGSNAVYRMRIPQTIDAHGNRVRETFLGAWTLSSAGLRPALLVQPPRTERTEEVNVTFLVRYLNGSNVSADDLASAPVGCFVRESQVPATTPNPCGALGVQTTQGKAWGQGFWSFTTRYGRDYPNLEPHRFYFANGTRDKWDNEIWDTRTNTFEVVPAKPRIEFSTVVRGADETTLERGNLVYVSAVIKYADGNAYNHSLRYSDPSFDPRILQAKLTKRGVAAAGERYGPVVSVETLELREVDEWGGRWQTSLQLTDDDTLTPAGRWSIEINATDNLTVPNANITTFDRLVVGAQIFVCDVYPQGSTGVPYFTGTTLRWRYRLEYDGCGMGRPVPSARIGTNVVAHVYRYDVKNANATGAPVSGVLVPRVDAETGEWLIEYTIEKQLFNGTYAVALGGEDAFHNPLARGASLPHFATRSPAFLRAVLTQPSEKVFRGEVATAIFEAQPGDVGFDPAKPTRVQLERYFPRGTPLVGTCAAAEDGGAWCGEVLDVRAEGYEDHVGQYPVNLDTPVGVYRFALQGRDKDFNVITAITNTFQIEPTSVARVLFTSPPPQVLKGERFWYTAEFQPGDRYDGSSATVWFNGRKTEITGVRIEPRIDVLNVSWTVPYDLQPGNYTIRVEGRDLTGNVIVVESPPFETSALSLTGRVIGSPTKAVKRGETATFIFGVTYPNGAYYLAPASPSVKVIGPEGYSADASLRREGLTIIATWQMPAEAPEGAYFFKVEGEAAAGNLFPDLQSPPFQPAAGRVTRRIIGDISDITRMGVDVMRVPRGSGDKSAECKLAYYGEGVSDFLVFQGRATPQTTSTIPHVIDDRTNTYACTLVTNANTPTGKYRLLFEGVDAFDNEVVAQSRAFVVLPATAVISWDPFPDSSAFKAGETIELSFVVRYTTGLVMTGDEGMPGAILKYGDAPVQPKPEVTYEDGRFVLRWKAPDELPPGSYVFQVAGVDNVGNTISPSTSTTYVVRTDPVESLAQVAENKVPAPPVAVLVLALVALALMIRRRNA